LLLPHQIIFDSFLTASALPAATEGWMGKDPKSGGGPDPKEVQKAAKGLAAAIDQLSDTNADLEKNLRDADKSVDILQKDDAKAQAERYQMLQDIQDNLAKNTKELLKRQTAFDKAMDALKKLFKS
jgi:septal ring factor EnvC (AmiA/AmiB activator)